MSRTQWAPALRRERCPLWDKCRAKESKPSSHRTVFISDYQLQQRNALAFTKTAEFQELMKQRSQIERVIAGLVRYNGARQAKATGVASADFQAKMGAVSYNLKRWRTLIHERSKTPPNAPPLTDH